jgi:hypothetical protein
MRVGHWFFVQAFEVAGTQVSSAYGAQVFGPPRVRCISLGQHWPFPRFGEGSTFLESGFNTACIVAGCEQHQNDKVASVRCVLLRQLCSAPKMVPVPALVVGSTKWQSKHTARW